MLHAGVIIPTAFNFNRSRILDFVLEYDPKAAKLKSLFLSSHRNAWIWQSVDCYYQQSNVSIKCNINRYQDEPIVICPVPLLEQTALERNQTKIFVSLKIFDSSTNPQSQIVSPLLEIPVYERQFHNISVYTMIKNKKHELIEWIEYHRLIGIEHFYLYDHESDDNVDAFLKSYIDANIVTIVRWPYKPLPGYHWNMIQSASMNHMLKNFGVFNDWVGYFDVDEYFFIDPTLLQSIRNQTNTLFNLLNDKFPQKVYPGGAQFRNCPMSCALTQEDIVTSRYSLTIEKCNIPPSTDAFCDTRKKMFIRPSNVHMMQNIHALERTKFAPSSITTGFGQFRHFHYGSVSSNLAKNTRLDSSIIELIESLRKKVIH